MIVLHNNEPCIRTKCPHCLDGIFEDHPELEDATPEYCGACKEGYTYQPLTQNISMAKEMLTIKRIHRITDKNYHKADMRLINIEREEKY